MIRRIVLQASMVVLAAVALDTAAQAPRKVHRVAFIATTSPVSELTTTNPASQGFARGMRDRGYVEGRNLIIEWRTAEGKLERIPEILRELVSIPVDVIVTVYNPMTLAAKEMTRTIPIVMASSLNPVEEGLVQSLARPGGNVTGLTTDLGSEVYGKRLELLKELQPKIAEVTVLGPSSTPVADREVVEMAARQLGMRVRYVVPEGGHYAEALSAIARERPHALLIMQSPMTYANRLIIAQFNLANRLPAMYPSRDHVLAGGLMAYGADLSDQFHAAAGYVDRILKGANPATLPVERPSTFRLVINVKTAKAIGLTLPAGLLLRADELIE